MLEKEAEDPAKLAARFINQTNKNIFLTGKAGTGKTTFLRKIIESTHKKAVIVAPTGIAAINAGGVTIHSLFQLPFGSFVPVNQGNGVFSANAKINDPLSVIKNLQMGDRKRNLLREMELLIIDEVSMLRADLLDAIDTVLKYIRRNNNLPFGGVQVLFIGDLLQLPPVVKDEEWKFLKQYYKSIFFFDALALTIEKPVYIELEKIYRQSEGKFISLLNNLRNNLITNTDIELLNNHFKPGFQSNHNENHITLTTHNYKAENINKQFLQKLNASSFYFSAIVNGDFSEYSYPVEKELELKVGAQIMFIKNDPSGEKKFFNGKIGIVSTISENNIEVEFENKTKVKVEKYEWKNIRFKLNESTNEVEEEEIGSFTQYPIKLAWAITVHKSQGLTFDKAIIDIGDAFAPGQVYVALSRLRSLGGLVLTSKVNLQSIDQDSNVLNYSSNKAEIEKLNGLIETERYKFLKDYLFQSFDFNNLAFKLREHTGSYIKDDKKSEKQKFQDWAIELKKQLETEKLVADKFLVQITKLLQNKDSNEIDFLYKRIVAAKEYFLPVFESLSLNILNQIIKVKTEKRIKAYLNELFEVELLLYEKYKQICKASILTESIIGNKEFTKQEVLKVISGGKRNELINKINLHEEIILQPKVNRKKKKTEDDVETKPKKPKGASQEETLKLFKEGKTVEQIAETRGFAITTIEGHLATFVAKGKLDANLLVPQEKIETIIKASKQLNTFQLNSLKQVLSNQNCCRLLFIK